jgi:HAMP domain-containing protein
MGKFFTLTGRIAATVLFVVLFLSSGLFPPTAPREAAAQKVSNQEAPDYDAMMPKSLAAASRKLHRQYQELMSKVNALQADIMTRQKAGAAPEELCQLDNQLTELVSAAEKIKVEADYVDELYTVKEREYMGR